MYLGPNIYFKPASTKGTIHRVVKEHILKVARGKIIQVWTCKRIIQTKAGEPSDNSKNILLYVHLSSECMYCTCANALPTNDARNAVLTRF